VQCCGVLAQACANSVTLAIASQSWHCANHELMTDTLETQFASFFEWLAEEK